jgi:hypothetical protein
MRTKIMIVLLAVTTQAFAQDAKLDCKPYNRQQLGITTEEFELVGRCGEGRIFLDPDCKMDRDEGAGDHTRMSLRSIKCNFTALGTEGVTEQLDDDGNVVTDEYGVPKFVGTGEFTYDYDVSISGLCCK